MMMMMKYIYSHNNKPISAQFAWAIEYIGCASAKSKANTTSILI